MTTVLKKIFKICKYILNCILDLIYCSADRCCICSEYTNNHVLLCDDCFNKIKFCADRHTVEKDNYKIVCYSAAYYSSVIKEMIIKLKYKNDFNAGKVLSNVMEKILIKNDIKFDYITYVPMTRHDLKKRGYNQSRFLAKSISNENHIEVLTLINKSKDSKDQIGLTSEERWDNLKGCFEFVGNREKIKGKNILLVDDVMTTGATSYYCAKELIDNNVNDVTILTAAKSKL